MKMLATLSGKIYWTFSCSECKEELKYAFWGNHVKHPENNCQHSGSRWEFKEWPKLTMDVELTKLPVNHR